MKIDIILQFDGADKYTGNWAREEKYIDFHKESEKAARCTIAYAAEELKVYLAKTLTRSHIRFASEASADRMAIYLVADDLVTNEDTYRLVPGENSLLINGAGRIGVLYGVYELLKLQGWRWYEPGEKGEIAPEPKDELLLPDKELTYKTETNTARGFYIEGLVKESEELLVWMARNRMNQGVYRVRTEALSRKLGIEGEAGGHIFEDILNPERVLSSGRTVWEEHPEWYGVPLGGEKVRENALKTQFCVSQDSLIDFLGEELLWHIMTEWKGAERINIWGFDTWGSVCNCDKCKALGNGTDQNLYFMSKVREYMDQAREDGRLDHDIKLIMCVYEGTSSMDPPEKPIPRNMVDAGDYMVFCPIVRCYAHDFDEDNCSYNKYYKDCFLGWAAQNPKLSIVIMEYFNVTKFEDLPLLFTQRLKKDIPFYAKNGADGFSYMHLPVVNWAMRTLTQILFAELIWDPDMDVDRYVEEYYQKRYGMHGDLMKRVYQLTEEAGRYIMSWRAWKEKSVLSKLMEWNGEIPEKPLEVDDHLETPDKCEQMGADSEAKLTEALKLVQHALHIEKKADCESAAMSLGAAVNPVELQKAQMNSRVQMCLEEDKRFLIYGLDTMQLMCRLSAYYNALYNREMKKASVLWRQVEVLEEKMESYYIPISFAAWRIELVSKDALTRTQLRDTIRKCRRYRVVYGLEMEKTHEEKSCCKN